jgi:dipeptidyl aminopeptidase/acylaminoacyl peptidase
MRRAASLVLCALFAGAILPPGAAQAKGSKLRFAQESYAPGDRALAQAEVETWPGTGNEPDGGPYWVHLVRGTQPLWFAHLPRYAIRVGELHIGALVASDSTSETYRVRVGFEVPRVQDGRYAVWVCRADCGADKGFGDLVYGHIVVARERRADPATAPHEPTGHSTSPDTACSRNPEGGGAIAFVRELGERGIWLVRPNGDEQRLTVRQEDYGPAWSPDGTRIAFVRFHADGSDVYVMRADGSHVRALTPGEGYYGGASWSPDGRKIVFGGFGGSRDGRQGELFVMRADGMNLEQLTHNEWNDLAPHWSPDGSTIVFASHRDGNTDLYLMDPDGTNERRLTHNRARDTMPAWSPDGSWIVFVSNRPLRDQDLFLIRPDGTGLTRLTHNDALDWTPAWSPDGTKVAFTRSRYPAASGRNQQLLVIIDVRTHERTRIAISPAFELHPDWRSN